MIFNNKIEHRTALLRCLVAAVAFAAAVSFVSASHEKETTMALNSKDAAHQGPTGGGVRGSAIGGGSDSSNSNAGNAGSRQGQGNKGAGNQYNGGLGNGKTIKSIPAPNTMLEGNDTNGGATPPVEPVDLSLLAGPQDLPKRKPLISPSVAVPQTGVTGYAGVFIP